jgi:GxxExxY protein
MTSYTPLPAETETVATKVIGCAIEVHRTLGAGFLESIYKRAMHLELEAQGLRFESEKAVVVKYKAWSIPGQRLDLIVEGVVLVELKSVRNLKSIHRAQVISYLKTTELRLGLLINFHSALLRNGLRRVIL